MLRIVLLLIELFVAFTAISCGAMLIIRPDGALMQMPLSMLANTPFSDFLIPGMALGFAVGGSALVALFLVAFGRALAQHWVILSGVMLGGWITVQVLLIGASSMLQAIYFIIAVVIFVFGIFYGKIFIEEYK